MDCRNDSSLFENVGIPESWQEKLRKVEIILISCYMNEDFYTKFYTK